VRCRDWTLLPYKREETCLGLTHGTQFNEANARGVSDGARWRSHVGLHNQRLRMELSEIRSEFIGTIGWIERGTRGTGSYCETCHGHLGAMREHERNPILATNAHGTQSPHHMLDVLP
jgi:hypothetical protein